jgi:2-polyprenyl-3-methyl-5-hydroxy-6-metoxy-1,4-benzoquinol methylase
MSDNDLIKEQIAQANWYHSFEVLPGIITPGQHFIDARKIINDRYVLPQDLTGMVALDIGALDGPYSFELERRGATVTALDIQDPDHTGFNTAKHVRQSKVQYVQGNVYELSTLLDQKFDIVMFFGVWYHLKNPVAAFDQLSGIVKDTGMLLLEGECFVNYAELPDGRASSDYKLIKSMANSNLPISLFYSGTYKKDKWSWYIPNLACIKEWLTASGFELINHGFINKYPHQRLYGTARKAKNPTVTVDNPVW